MLYLFIRKKVLNERVSLKLFDKVFVALFVYKKQNQSKVKTNTELLKTKP